MSTSIQEQVLKAQIALFERLAEAASRYATELRTMVPDEEPDPVSVRGPIQRRIVRLPELFTDGGMAASEVARSIDYDEANVYAVLSSLERGGSLEQVSGANPRRWRFAPRHRTDRVLRLSRLVPEGRWTTYGDFAIAVYGSPQMARAIGQAAARNLAFAKPHRVLNARGRIPPGWRDDEGRGPDRCAELLAQEHVRLDAYGKADPKRFVGWRELKRLLDDEPLPDDVG
jgi:alkylated DNA nucleotide flippase Atl1